MEFTIYTDGACDTMNELHPGGCAYVVLQGGKKIAEQSYSEIHTTNSRMELSAILNSISALPDGAEATIITDSRNAIEAMSHRRRSVSGQNIVDAWDEAVREKHITVRFRWIKGHSGDEWNMYVDMLSNLTCDDLARELGDHSRLPDL